MKPLKFTNLKLPKFAAGDFLIEAMIGVLLMGIVGAGITFVTSRVSASQHDMAMQDIIISKLRGMLLENGVGVDVCGQTPFVYLPNEEVLRVQVSGCGANAVASIDGVALSSVQAPIVLTVNSPSMGEISVGGTIAAN